MNSRDDRNILIMSPSMRLNWRCYRWRRTHRRCCCGRSRGWLRKTSPIVQFSLRLHQLRIKCIDLIRRLSIRCLKIFVACVEEFDVRFEVLDVSVFSFAECALRDSVLFSSSLWNVSLLVVFLVGRWGVETNP